MIIGTKQQRQKMKLSSTELDGELSDVVPEARNLDVIIDSSLTMEAHVNNVCKLCYIQLRNITKIRRYLTTEATKRLIQALVISRLDYCNVLSLAYLTSFCQSYRKYKIRQPESYLEHHIEKA